MHKTWDIELVDEDDKNFSTYYSSENPEKSLRFFCKFNQINIIVGANNSGKSRFLRNFMNTPNLVAATNSKVLLNRIYEFNEIVEELNFTVRVTAQTIKLLVRYYDENQIDKLGFDQNQEFGLTNIDAVSSLEGLSEQIIFNSTVSKKIFKLFEFYNIHGPERSRFINSLYVNGIGSNSYDFKNSRRMFDKVNGLLKDLLIMSNKFKVFEGARVYIPTLRTAHSLFEQEWVDSELNSGYINKKIKKNIFLDTVRKNYSHLHKDVEIFTGLDLYNDIVNVRNSVKEERTKFHEFEKFLSINFFNGEEIDVVAKFNIDDKEKGIDEEDIIQVFIGGKSRKLHNLGDGVQALIILMYKIFLATKDSLIFIDEPELNLHPGFQRLFLEQITSNKELTKKNLTYIIVTHSNHFLDLTLEKDNVSIYSFSSKKKDKFLIRNVNSGDNQTLRNLGVNNSSVFLANCSIWVEGVSDRNLIKAFLKAYCKNKKLKEPREDIDFAFFEYAGSNLQHYNFKKTESEFEESKNLITSYALNNRIFLLSDLDSGATSKHNNLKEIAGEYENFQYETTAPYREIENLLDNAIWEKVLPSFYNRNKVKEEKKVQSKIVEALNKTKVEKYKSQYIGSFLKDLNIGELKKVWNEDKNGEPGTFVYKTDLSQNVLNLVKEDKISWNEFAYNKTVSRITKNIYEFIMNQRN